jgi:PPM family protein phosphatase
MRLISFAHSDIGLKRKINQDSYLKDDAQRLFVVADGMGGHRGGEVASKLAVEVIQKFCRENKSLNPRERLDKAVNLSCQEIFKQSTEKEELSGMGTTVLAMLFEENSVYIAQVGDSRAYLIHQGGVWQVTEDHSLLNEEIRAGRIEAGQAANYQFKNVITRSVGYEKQVVVDIYRREIQANDMYFLCTDGLSGLVNIEEIGKEVQKHGPDQGLKNLVALANARGGDDNITALICHIVSI